jgi:hypothetical protein
MVRFFNAGNVYASGNSWSYIVSRIEELNRLIEHFEKYPLKGHRLECYKVWKTLVGMKQEFRRFDFQSLASTAEELTKRTMKGRRPSQ